MPYSNRAYRSLITTIAAVIMTACGNSDRASQKKTVIDIPTNEDTIAIIDLSQPE